VTRPILFLSDFGLDDEYVGVCHAVIARVAPQVRVIDLRHGTPARDVTAGAMTLAVAAPYAPEDAVFLAVVDPGVGTARRGVAVEAGGRFLVGPDNGVLAPAAAALGGPTRAVELEPGRVVTWPVSDTFHGRDVFAPAAARLAAGADLHEVGAAIDVGGLAEQVLAEPSVDRGRVTATVMGIDRFGNIRLGATPEHLSRASLDEPELTLRMAGRTVPVRRVRTFGDLDPSSFGLLVDSAGWMKVVRNGDDAAALLGVGPGDAVELVPLG
jgi:S-adenosyl-L-methionine hydrolase (adenosine-forming)